MLDVDVGKYHLAWPSSKAFDSHMQSLECLLTLYVAFHPRRLGFFLLAGFQLPAFQERQGLVIVLAGIPRLALH